MTITYVDQSDCKKCYSDLKIYAKTLVKSRASNLIVVVESKIKRKILDKNIEKHEVEAFFKKKCARKMIVLLHHSQ